MEGLSGLGMGLFSKMVVSWKKEQFCDVTIKCANLRKIKAPSIMLGTISSVLSGYLDQCCDNVLTTTEISIHLWRALLHVLYDGSLDCLQNEDEDMPTLRDVRQFAEALDISSVKEMCDGVIETENNEPSSAEQRHIFRYIDKNPLEFNLVFYVDTNNGKARVTALCQASEVENFHEFRPLETIKTLDEDGIVSDIILPEQLLKTEDTHTADGGLETVTPTKTLKDVNIILIKQEISDDDKKEPASDEDNCSSADEDKNYKKPSRKTSGSKKSKKTQVKKKTVQATVSSPKTPVKNNSSRPSLETTDIRRSGRNRGKRKTWTPYGREFVIDGNQPPKNEDGLKMSAEVETKETIEGRDHSPRKRVKIILDDVLDEEEYVDTESAVLSKKKKACFQCTRKCTADWVQCRICFQIVDGRTLQHVEDEHPVWNNVIWPVTCAIDEIQPEEEEVMIGRSTVGYIDGGEETGTVYQCMECIDMFISKDEYEQHLRDHTEAVFSCKNKNCHFAFRTEASRMEHQHFCLGGRLLKCPTCKMVLGGMIGLSKHKCGKDKRGPVFQLSRNFTEVKTSKELSKPVDKMHEMLKGQSKSTTRSHQKKPTSLKSLTPKISKKMLVEENVLKRIGTDLIPLGLSTNAKQVGHLIKCCKDCGCNCESTVVQCLYCGKFVPKTEEELHILGEHSLTPSNYTWPVQCQGLPETAPTLVVCKFHTETSQATTDGDDKQRFTAPYNNQKSPHYVTDGSEETKDSPANETDQTPKTTDNIILFPRHPSSGISSSGDDKPGICCLCDFTCNTKKDLASHMKERHERAVMFCRTCHHGFDAMKPFTEHSYYCEGNSMYACARCDRSVVGGLKEAKDHEDAVHTMTKHIDKTLFNEVIRPTEVRQLKYVQRCFHCGPEGCKNAKKGLVKCVYCSQIVKNDVNHMLEHPFTPKSSVWPVMCRYLSGKNLRNENPLVAKKVKGQEGQDGKRKRIIKCLICGYVAEIPAQMITHIKSKHGAKSAHACAHCDTVFNKYETWRDHEHFCGGGDLLTCGVCNAICGGLKALNDHLCRNHPEAKGSITQHIKGIAKRARVNKEEAVIEKEKNEDEEEDEDWMPEKKEKEVVSDTTKVIDANLKALKQVCLTCGESGCKKDNVKCLYCRKIVGNTLQHMQHHCFTPAESTWPVNCNEEPDQSSPVLAEKNYHGKAMKIKMDCLICKSFTSAGFKEMYRHFKQAHQIDGSVYRCKPCGMIFNEYAPFKDHVHFCAGGDLLKCDLCSTLCGGYQQLITHIADAHSDQPDAPLQIKEHGTSIELTITPGPMGSTLLSHYAFDQEDAQEDIDGVFERDEARKQDCFACEGSCRVAEPKYELVKCLLCNQLVANDMAHMSEKHPHTPPTSDWNVTCRTWKNYQDTLVIVEKSATVHPKDGLLRLECKLCSFTTKPDEHSGMTEHVRETHNSSVHFCEHCECGLKRLNAKNDHERLCGGHGFPWCDICGKRCTGYETLGDHMKNAHCDTNDTSAASRENEMLSDEDAPQGKTKKLREKGRKWKRKLAGMNFDPTKGKPDENGIVTLCGSCGTHCIAHNVRCFLCFATVPNTSNHLLEQHSFTPSKTWIVSCKQSNAPKVYKKKEVEIKDGLIVGMAQSVAFLVKDMAEGDEIYGSEANVRVGLDIKCTLHHEMDVFDVLPTMEEFTRHIDEFHGDLKLQPIQICQHCNMIFSRRDWYYKGAFVDHERFCGGDGLYWCEICNVPFTGARKLADHNSFKKHEKPTKKGKQRGLYQIHIHVPKGSFIQCLECAYQGQSFNEYKDHVMEIHQYKYCQIQVCSFCLKAFKVNTKRQLHEQLEHKGGERLFCNVCNRDFATPTSLRVHQIYHHEGGRIKQKLYRDTRPKIPCSFCGKLFQLSIHVRKHELTTHLHQKPYQCRLCGQRFTNHSACKTHEDRHTGNKRCKCPYCDYRAYKGSRVNEHIKTKHPGQKRAYGWDHVTYGDNAVVDKGDEFTIEGNFSYKPRTKKQEFDFGDYEETMDTTTGLASKTLRNRSGQILVRSIGNPGSQIVNINMLPSASGDQATQQQMYFIQGDGESTEPMAVYVSEADMEAFQTNPDIKYIMDDTPSAVGVDNSEKVHYIVDGGGAENIKYVDVVNQDIQYALGTEEDNKNVQYVIDANNVADDAKQEVEMIINSANVVTEPTETIDGNKVFLKSLLGSPSGSTEVGSRLMDESADHSAKQVYYIVNKE